MVRRTDHTATPGPTTPSHRDVLEQRMAGDTGRHSPRDADRLEVIDTTVQRTYEWINEVNEILGWGSMQQAYTGMRAVLHALRDRLTIDEAAHLAAQLPMLVRGIFFEGWKPAATPVKSRTLAEFLEQINKQFHGGAPRLNPEELARATFAVIQRHVTRGEIDDVKHMMPPEVRVLWPEGEGQPDRRARKDEILGQSAEMTEPPIL